MSVSITLQVPPSLYRLARQTADVTSKPVEQVLADVLAAASPLSDDLPPDLQKKLDALALLNDEALLELARKTIPAAKRRRYDQLLEKNSSGTLTQNERAQLSALRRESELLTLKKAHAYALLKWRGYALPALTELPVPQ